MHFLSPIFFVLSIFIAAVILFYFFRKQYDEKTISSNMLWEQVLNEWQASPFLKKLQQNLLFWLQILALFLLLFSLVKPFWYEEVLKGDHIILVIDTSASMSAEFEESNRFEYAKNELLELVKLLHGREVTLIGAGENPEILLNRENELTMIKEEIKNLQLSYEHENMKQALNLAVSLSPEDNSAIHIFSDAVVKDDVKDDLNDQYAVIHNISKASNNLSLQSFGVSSVDNQIVGIAVIENQTNEAKKIHFTVSSGGEVLFEQNISIEGNASFPLRIPALPRKSYYEATILNQDSYQIDNFATSIYTESTPTVYGIGDVNPFALKGFQTIGVELLQIEEGSTNAADMKGIVVAEGKSVNALPKQPLILFNTSTEKIKLTNKITAKEDPLLQYVDTEKMYIDSATKALEGDFDTILSSGEIPLIQTGRVNGMPMIVLNFSLSDSDWPLQPSFPIFLYHSYQFLAQQTDFLGYFGSGEEKWLNVQEDAPEWKIYDHEDENLYSLDLTKESFHAPVVPGTYQAVSGNQIYYFSVLLDEREKQDSHEAGFTLNEPTSADDKVKNTNNQLWYWLIILALILMAAEWEVHRRGHRG